MIEEIKPPVYRIKFMTCGVVQRVEEYDRYAYALKDILPWVAPSEGQNEAIMEIYDSSGKSYKKDARFYENLGKVEWEML